MFNMDFSQRVVIRSAELDWVKSPAGTWLRSPHMSMHTPLVEQETIIYVKTGHLPLSPA